MVRQSKGSVSKSEEQEEVKPQRVSVGCVCDGVWCGRSDRAIFLVLIGSGLAVGSYRQAKW